MNLDDAARIIEDQAREIAALRVALADTKYSVECMREANSLSLALDTIRRIDAALSGSPAPDPAVSPDVKWIVDKEMVSLRLIDEEDSRDEAAEAMRAKCEAIAQSWVHGEDDPYGVSIGIVRDIAALKGNGEGK